MNNQKKSGQLTEKESLLKHILPQAIVLLLLAQGHGAFFAPAEAMNTWGDTPIGVAETLWRARPGALGTIQRRSPWVTRSMMMASFWYQIEPLARNPDLEVWSLTRSTENTGPWNSSNFIGDDGAKALADALSRPESKVHTLRLVQNDIGSDGATALARALSLPHSKVHTLDLAGNRIGDSGIAALAGALRLPHSKVHTLNLENNGIESSGVIALAGALRSPHSKIHTLNLSKNKIGDDGAKALGEVLIQPNNLVTHLDLRGIQSQQEIGLIRFSEAREAKITSTGVIALVGALIHPHSKVIDFNFEGNEVEKAVEIIIKEAIELNKKKTGA